MHFSKSSSIQIIFTSEHARSSKFAGHEVDEIIPRFARHHENVHTSLCSMRSRILYTCRPLPLYTHCTIVPLNHCTIVPFCHCTIIPLYTCEPLPWHAGQGKICGMWNAQHVVIHAVISSACQSTVQFSDPLPWQAHRCVWTMVAEPCQAQTKSSTSPRINRQSISQQLKWHSTSQQLKWNSISPQLKWHSNTQQLNSATLQKVTEISRAARNLWLHSPMILRWCFRQIHPCIILCFEILCREIRIHKIRIRQKLRIRKIPSREIRFLLWCRDRTFERFFPEVPQLFPQWRFENFSRRIPL